MNFAQKRFYRLQAIDRPANDISLNQIILSHAMS